MATLKHKMPEIDKVLEVAQARIRSSRESQDKRVEALKVLQICHHGVVILGIRTQPTIPYFDEIRIANLFAELGAYRDNIDSRIEQRPDGLEISRSDSGDR